jgi:hypothetical protein
MVAMVLYLEEEKLMFLKADQQVEMVEMVETSLLLVIIM